MYGEVLTLGSLSAGKECSFEFNGRVGVFVGFRLPDIGHRHSRVSVRSHSPRMRKSLRTNEFCFVTSRVADVDVGKVDDR